MSLIVLRRFICLQQILIMREPIILMMFYWKKIKIYCRIVVLKKKIWVGISLVEGGDLSHASTTAYSGAKVAKGNVITDKNSYLSSNVIKVEPNTDYTLSFYYKSSNIGSTQIIQTCYQPI